ncbi:MAG: hypothetical protein HY316_10660 [Acidobacteria bacterium]|nr:hypothetical protein [Acidobacteriota bacterium]
MRKVFLLLACLLMVVAEAFAQLRTATVPDEIFYNGKIVTVDGAFSIEQAFAVRGEEILAVGSSAEKLNRWRLTLSERKCFPPPVIFFKMSSRAQRGTCT